MMRIDSGGGPSPEDELHQLIRHCRPHSEEKHGYFRAIEQQSDV